MASGGGNMTPAINPLLEDIRRKVPQCTVAWCNLTAFPLPTDRQRIVIVVSTDSSHPADSLIREMTELHERIKQQMPGHRVACFLGRAPKPGTSKLTDTKVGKSATVAEAQAEACKEASYHGAFSKALEKAVSKNRVPSDLRIPLLDARPSKTDGALQACSSWLRAQADVYSLIAEHCAQNEGVTSGKAFFTADLSQSADRGRVFLRGKLQTASRLQGDQ